MWCYQVGHQNLTCLLIKIWSYHPYFVYVPHCCFAFDCAMVIKFNWSFSHTPRYFKNLWHFTVLSRMASDDIEYFPSCCLLPMNIISFFLAFILTQFLHIQLPMSLRHFITFSTLICSSSLTYGETVHCSEWSSANLFNPRSDGNTMLRVLAYALNKDGPPMEICGTPIVKNLTEEYSSLMFTLKPLLARCDLNQPNAAPQTTK